MISRIQWIELPLTGRLAVVARPRAGDWLVDEVTAWRAAGIALVVSLLEPQEAAELGLQSEAGLCGQHAIEFISFPIPDRGVPPSLQAALDVAQLLASRISRGMTAAVHCRAGIGRSAVIAACTLICAGVKPDEAFDMIARARGVDVPDTEEQRAWVKAFADWRQSV